MFALFEAGIQVIGSHPTPGFVAALLTWANHVQPLRGCFSKSIRKRTVFNGVSLLLL